MLFLTWQNTLKTRTGSFYLKISSTVHPILSRFLTKAFIELVLLELIGKEYENEIRQTDGERCSRISVTDKGACCKWFDRGSVTMLLSNTSGMQSTSNVQRRMKGSVTKIPVPCQNIIRMYNHSMMASTWSAKEQQLTILIVNLQLVFFELIDTACANSFVIYSMRHQNDLTLLDYKTIP